MRGKVAPSKTAVETIEIARVGASPNHYEHGCFGFQPRHPLI
jgi:hypothetical protein